jgi:hypothetical protein
LEEKAKIKPEPVKVEVVQVKFEVAPVVAQSPVVVSVPDLKV